MIKKYISVGGEKITGISAWPFEGAIVYEAETVGNLSHKRAAWRDGKVVLLTDDEYQVRLQAQCNAKKAAVVAGYKGSAKEQKNYDAAMEKLLHLEGFDLSKRVNALLSGDTSAVQSRIAAIEAMLNS